LGGVLVRPDYRRNLETLMQPVKFDGYETILGAPTDWKQHEIKCVALPIMRQDGACISLWSFSWKERWQILMGRRLWVWVYGGITQPPIGFAVEEPARRQ